eukprot:CAMPEP_0197187944 /NCGR_PEP_ID=MMETSP1423-20130617/16887_1 /TAXON_ID=476441 /ORGANISM="Pseudo-nitzschia heimii, Strain UNC1101" /LENGTH=477 /DNA_ID=CAMNT_0042639661 /DNA_START=253 /DNA_END=1686 /DNA_ORIENTATION=-
MLFGADSPILLHDLNKTFHYISAYALYVALWALLSAVTLYRREISCNRLYHEDDQDETNKDAIEDNSNWSAWVSGNKSSRANDEIEIMAEELLEGAGLYCSGRPILNFAELLLLGFGNYHEGEKNSISKNLTPEDLLDRVGNYASPEPILATIACFRIWKKTEVREELKPLSSPLSSSLLFSNEDCGCDPLMRNMPPDVHVQIASFLHPREVVTLACVSKAYYNIIHDSNNTASAALWKTLWLRDYAWIVFKWKIGKLAFERSNCAQWCYNKDFYFLFGQSYLDYVLAGHNTFDSCLVGIHSHIYNITPFLFRHPGSPDTLMVYSGRDATRFFHDMGHSTGARKLAMSMCVVVNRSAQNVNNDYGVFPTVHTEIDESVEFPLPQRLPNGEDNLIRQRGDGLKSRIGDNSVSNGGGTLQKMRTRFLDEREKVRNRNTKIYSDDPTILGNNVNTYFDPFRREWRIWYTDTDLNTIYLPA